MRGARLVRDTCVSKLLPPSGHPWMLWCGGLSPRQVPRQVRVPERPRAQVVAAEQPLRSSSCLRNWVSMGEAATASIIHRHGPGVGAPSGAGAGEAPSMWGHGGISGLRP